MSKPFKTIDEQIELLRYRGMTIAAYRSGCVGFWAVFRCYKAERWGLDSL